jgi:enamine deaminase RidA (YjgF/YER057c/UK114 family)
LLSATETVGSLALLTWTTDSGRGETPEQAEHGYRALDEALRAAGAAVLQERVFGSLAAAPQILRARGRATRDDEAWAVPPTLIEGTPIGGEGIAGVHVLAAQSARSRLVSHGGLVLGRLVETPDAHLLGLADVGRLAGPARPEDPAAEAATVIDAAEQVLTLEGFSFRDVARTWYYLRDILAWYGPFNGARNAAFRRMGLIGPSGDGAVPASTGIGGRGLAGAWCTLDLLAARAVGGHTLEMTRLHNTRQNEATAYGSAFARGMALALGNHRYLFVSGTASIDDHGATVHAGDVEAQTRHTIDAIAALLEGAGASLDDIRQATAFLRHPRDVDRFQRTARQRGLAAIPMVTVAADACRDDLLVELDATAMVPIPPGEARR